MSDRSRFQWRRLDELLPVRGYEAGPYEIRWDPAGQREGDPGGWWLWDGFKLLGIYRTLRDAKAAAEGDWDALAQGALAVAKGESDGR